MVGMFQGETEIPLPPTHRKG